MDEFDNDNGTITSDQLTRAQINQLKTAWELSNAELLKYKALVLNLTQKNESLTDALKRTTIDLDLEMTKSQLSQSCSINPGKPVLLTKELSKLMPTVNYHSLIVTAVVRVGESWMGLSSNAIADEMIAFKSRAFDDMLKLRVRTRSKVSIEVLKSILPSSVISYIYHGNNCFC